MASIDQLIAGFQKDNPRLYEAFKAVSADLAKINETLYPFIAASTTNLKDIEVGPPDNFTVSASTTAVTFNWDAVTSAGAYEVREGEDWDTANFIVRTVSLSASILPILIGTHNYLIKSISRGGNYSVESNSVSINILGPGLISIQASVIDNNILLRWEEPSAEFDLIHYHVYREGVEIGTVTSTFFTYFETAGGEYTYGIQAHDLAGNHGAISSIIATVNQPPDFVLESSLTSDLNGTLTNVKLITGPKLLACVVTGRTWQQHFDDNSWSSIQEQVDAGYPIYAEPSETTGTAELKFDFGAIFENVIISVNWSEEVLDGDVSATCEIKYSDDDITYSAYVAGSTLFAASLRYVKAKLTFTGDDDKSLSNFYDVTCAINVKREMDGGTVEVFAADGSGTAVDFNKEFKDIESITLTPLSTSEQTAIYDFTDVPYPTTFYIYLFDDTGTRTDGVVSWKARGIM